jgi:hypothetical protein
MLEASAANLARASRRFASSSNGPSLTGERVSQPTSNQAVLATAAEPPAHAACIFSIA